MSLIPHGYFPRSAYDMDQWFKPILPHTGAVHSTLDLFDPFDELDNVIGRNLQWLNKPDFMPMSLMPRVPQKYRITVDCVGYRPESIKTEVNGNKLTVTGREEVKQDDDYSIREFKKSYELPKHAEVDKLVSFMAPHGELVVEVPLKEIASHMHQDLFPRIVDAPNGGKAVSLQFGVPENIDPSKISVHVKDRDLIVKAEDKMEKPDGVSKFYYYKRTTLPENTNFDALKVNYDNHQIQVAAPLKLDYKPYKSVPIEHKKHEQITHHDAKDAKNAKK